MLRTHDCGKLRSEDLGKRVTLAGWVRFRRDHGGVLFFDLADSNGTTQLVFDPEALRQEIDQKSLSETLNSIGREYVVQAMGVVRERVPGTEDPRNPTGMVEVLMENAVVLSTSKAIPFEVADQKNSMLPNEDLRIRYRYLDLRRSQMMGNLRFRARLFAAAREALNGMGFMDVETPMLTRSTAEGARDFLVPSRIQPGHFYALPQSPQLFKQMLMVGSVERYYQFARCFRDEDSRADRQPEFTQMDVEMSFVEERDVQEIMERVLRSVWMSIYNEELPTPFPRLSYHDSMARFGTDAPDTRFALELAEVTEIVRHAHYEIFQKILSKKGSAVVCINLKASLVKEKDQEFAGVGRKEVDRLIDWSKQQGMGGLTWMRCTPQGLESNIVKYFPEEVRRKLQEKMGAEVGDLLLFLAGPRMATLKAGGALRMKLARDNTLLEGKGHQFVWIVDCPSLPSRPGDREALRLPPSLREAGGGRPAILGRHDQGHGALLRPGARRQRDRVGLDPQPRCQRPEEGLQALGDERGGHGARVLLLPRGLRVRSSASRRNRLGDGPGGIHPPGVREHTRRDRLPQEQEVPIVGGWISGEGGSVEAAGAHAHQHRRGGEEGGVINPSFSRFLSSSPRRPLASCTCPWRPSSHAL